MAEDYDVPLPTYSGRLSNDWSSHEARLKAWLRIKGIPQHAREAADVLTLSLEPRSNAALTFDYASPAERQSFDDGVLFLRTQFDSLLRKRLAQASATNALETRTFRERGRRKEFIKDLLSDLEPLLLRAGKITNQEKREVFIRAFVEFPRAVKMLGKTTSFDEAVTEALRWEAVMIQKELELNTRARQPREEPSSTRSHRFHPSGIPPPRPPSPSHSPSAPKSTHIPHPIIIPTSTASAPHSAPPPASPTPGASGGVLLSRRISATAGPSSAPSTIDEGAESSDLFGRPSIDRERPPNPTPNEAACYPDSPAGTSTAGRDPHTPNFDSMASRRSMSYLHPSQYEADQYDDEYSVPVRSRSVDFARPIGRGGGRTIRELGLSGVDVDDEDEEDGDERSRSTPPFVTDALHSDQEGDEAVTGRGRRSASALDVGEGARRGGGRRKLIRPPSSKKQAGRGDAMSDSNASTVTKASKIKSWFSGRGGKDKEGREGALSPSIAEGDRRLSLSGDHDAESRARRARLGVSAAWSRSVERLTRAPSPGPELMGRPAKEHLPLPVPSDDDAMPAFDPFASTSRQRQLPDLPFAKTQQQAGGGNKGKGKEVLVIDSDDDEEEEYGGGESGSGGEGYAEPGTDEDREALAKLDEELLDLSQQIEELKQLESTLMKDRTSLVSKIQSRRSKPAPMAPAGIKKKQASAVDFHRSDWAWSEEIRILAKERFGIKSFRMCQEPALNATLSGRDIMVVMPTGGGKSLIYQLPALLSDGTTIVITPLISLMQDQTYNLNALDVRAEMLNSATSQEDAREIMKRLVSGGQASTTVKGKGKAKVQTAPKSQADDQREIKLVYVTPEKIDKSKTFVSSLQKMYDAGLLARIIVDEAHCCSSLGHDYRVSYLCLGKLKTLFPNTPITALTATAPNSVVDDTLKILHMPRTISPGDAALPKTTVLFTSPLYRSNLHYSVVPKPKEADATIGALADYILEHHLGATGIIYCLSRTDTEKVSQGINDKSAGKIRCAVYHAGISDVEKLQIHKQWRRKNVHVICATTAFGLGIDAPEVRFVLHHSVTKSIEGYYQESGRAGRDGKDSDCVIFYRSSDSSRLSTLTYESFFTGGREKLYEMLAFAEDLETCRKLQFARYFATTSSKGAFEQGDASDEPCGHCDNCLRDSSTFETVDISLDAYRALRILAVAEQQNGTLTLMQAADLVRGLGGGSFSTQGKKSKGKGSVNVGEQAGGKVTLSREDTESMVLHLLLKGYLREEFYNTAYQTLIYIKTSQRALRFTRLSPEDVESNGVPAALTMTVRNKGKSKAKSKVVKRKASSTLTHVTKKAKGNATVVIDSDSDDDGPELEALEDDQDESFGPDEDEEAAMFEAGDFDVDGNGGFESPNHQVDGDGWEVWGTGAKKVVLRGESSDVEVLD